MLLYVTDINFVVSYTHTQHPTITTNTYDTPFFFISYQDWENSRTHTHTVSTLTEKLFNMITRGKYLNWNVVRFFHIGIRTK